MRNVPMVLAARNHFDLGDGVWRTGRINTFDAPQVEIAQCGAFTKNAPRQAQGYSEFEF